MTTIDSPLQMSLGVSLRDDATFDNFYTSAANGAVIKQLRALKANSLDISAFLLWGSPGCGLTHILQAVCLENAKECSVQYLPMRDMLGFSPSDICEGLEQTELVCLDGIENICGDREWERAVFHLFNNLRDAGHHLLMSSHVSPPSLPVVLKDLKSRILGSMFLRLDSLTDEEKKYALINRANGRGMDMPEEVASYVLSRASRDTNELFNILNRLDDASLQEQRKLTIPFVKKVVSL